jgi:anti-sigma factor RsiW
MTCQSFDARLDALLDGRCTAAEWVEAEAHLAGCARCRRLFDAMSGRAGDLDDGGHEALAAAVVAKTSGGGRTCASARERLCDFVDGTLGAFDRDLVDGHLSRCGDCSALAAALAAQVELLPTFAALAPRRSLVRDVLAATSRKPVEPTATERIAAWLSRAAERPRFSLEVAYALTVLLLVVLGNPVDAFREASVRVQPRVSAVAVAVRGPLNEVRAAGAERIARVEQALASRQAAGERANAQDSLAARVEAWLLQSVLAPLQSLVRQVADWAWQVVESGRRAFVASPSEPRPPAAR